LLGPFIDAWLKVSPGDRLFARGLLAEMLERHLREAGVGSISEVIDAEPPNNSRRLYRPGLEYRRNHPLLGENGSKGDRTIGYPSKDF